MHLKLYLRPNIIKEVIDDDKPYDDPTNIMDQLSWESSNIKSFLETDDLIDSDTKWCGPIVEVIMPIDDDKINDDVKKMLSGEWNSHHLCGRVETE
jgi:hypothetical protein